MCQVTGDQLLTALPLMPHSDALYYLLSKIQTCTADNEDLRVLQEWYNSDEKRLRILAAWKRMTLSRLMDNAQGLSEVSLFSSFVAKLNSV